MVQAPSTLDLLFEQAALLEPEERALLAHWLIDSIVEDSSEKEPGYDEYWDAEIARELDEIREGRAQLVEWDDALNQIFGPLRR